MKRSPHGREAVQEIFEGMGFRCLLPCPLGNAFGPDRQAQLPSIAVNVVPTALYQGRSRWTSGSACPYLAYHSRARLRQKNPIGALLHARFAPHPRVCHPQVLLGVVERHLDAPAPAVARHDLFDALRHVGTQQRLVAPLAAGVANSTTATRCCLQPVYQSIPRAPAIERENPDLAHALKKMEAFGTPKTPEQAQRALALLSRNELRAYREYFAAAGDEVEMPEPTNRAGRRNRVPPGVMPTPRPVGRKKRR